MTPAQNQWQPILRIEFSWKRKRSANAENGPPFFLVGEVRVGVFCFKFYLVWKADLDSEQ